LALTEESERWKSRKIVVFCEQTQFESSKQSRLGSRIQTSPKPNWRLATDQLFPSQRDGDFFVVAAKNYLAVFNPLDRDLINLSAELEAELLAFSH
jgi:hypothetical protein